MRLVQSHIVLHWRRRVRLLLRRAALHCRKGAPSEHRGRGGIESALGRSRSSSRCFPATAWAAGTLAGLNSWLGRLRPAGSDFELRSMDFAGCVWRLAGLGDCGSVRLVLMHEHHGSAVSLLRTLAGAFFGCSGTRRRRFRWAASRVSVWSQAWRRLGGHR